MRPHNATQVPELKRESFPAIAIGAISVGALCGLWLRILILEVFPALPGIQTLTISSSSAALTLANTIGTIILIACVMHWEKRAPTRNTQLFFATGLCGSLTSYSAFVAAIAPIPTPPTPQITHTSFAAISLISILGIIGAHRRWRDTTALTQFFLPHTPHARLYATATINIAASAINAIVTVCARYEPELAAFISIAVLGCYSTFSTAVVDAWQAWKSGHPTLAVTAFATTLAISTGIYTLIVLSAQMLN